MDTTETINKNITVKFFRVDKGEKGGDTPFEKSISVIYEKNPVEKIKTLYDDYDYQLNFFDTLENDYFCGELVRIAKNFPPYDFDESTSKLAKLKGIPAYCAAFVYDKTRQVLIVQNSFLNSLSHNSIKKIESYISKFFPLNYEFPPLFNENVMQKFNELKIKEFELEIAIDSSSMPLKNIPTNLITELFGAGKIGLTLKGGFNGFLGEEAKKYLMDKKEEPDVKKLKVKLDGEKQLISLLGDCFLMHSAKIDLPTGHVENRNKRIKFLLETAKNYRSQF